MGFVKALAIGIWIGASAAAADAQAPIVKVALTVVPGENSLSRTDARAAFRETRRIYAEQVGVNLVLVSTSVRRAPGALSRLDIANTTAQLYYWSRRFFKRRIGGVIDVAILPPVISWDGRSYFTGRAGGVCSLHNGFAYMTAPLVRDNGKSGLLLAPYVLAHELGHVLGAPHVESPTIMHPGPLAYVDEFGEIPFDAASVTDIRDCLRDWDRL